MKRPDAVQLQAVPPPAQPLLAGPPTSSALARPFRMLGLLFHFQSRFKNLSKSATNLVASASIDDPAIKARMAELTAQRQELEEIEKLLFPPRRLPWLILFSSIVAATLWLMRVRPETDAVLEITANEMKFTAQMETNLATGLPLSGLTVTRFRAIDPDAADIIPLTDIPSEGLLTTELMVPEVQEPGPDRAAGVMLKDFIVGPGSAVTISFETKDLINVSVTHLSEEPRPMEIGLKGELQYCVTNSPHVLGEPRTTQAEPPRAIFLQPDKEVYVSLRPTHETGFMVALPMWVTALSFQSVTRYQDDQQERVVDLSSIRSGTIEFIETGKKYELSERDKLKFEPARDQEQSNLRSIQFTPDGLRLKYRGKVRDAMLGTRSVMPSWLEVRMARRDHSDAWAFGGLVLAVMVSILKFLGIRLWSN
ncbi:MAG: hypothetical protein JXB05_09385 [Myxococcaceae bacterium]|nr:hypothetical protein [Myxococcaceae bacterium]